MIRGRIAGGSDEPPVSHRAADRFRRPPRAV